MWMRHESILYHATGDDFSKIRREWIPGLGSTTENTRLPILCYFRKTSCWATQKSTCTNVLTSLNHSRQSESWTFSNSTHSTTYGQHLFTYLNFLKRSTHEFCQMLLHMSHDLFAGASTSWATLLPTSSLSHGAADDKSFDRLWHASQVCHKSVKTSTMTKDMTEEQLLFSKCCVNYWEFSHKELVNSEQVHCHRLKLGK